MDITVFLNCQSEEKTDYPRISEEFKKLLILLGADEFVFQIELANFNLHIQCSVGFDRRIRTKQIYTQINAKPIFLYKDCRVVAQSNNGIDVQAYDIYCQKLETRVFGPVAHNVNLKFDVKNQLVSKVPRNLFPHNIFPWQQKFFDLYDLPAPDRLIFWIFDPIGGTGKTRLAQFLQRHCSVIILSYPTSTYDPVVAIADKGKHGNKMYIFDLTKENNAAPFQKSFFSILEDIKNERIEHTKYGGIAIKFPCQPHVIVFSNVLPSPQGLSGSRIIKLLITDTNESVVVYYSKIDIERNKEREIINNKITLGCVDNKDKEIAQKMIDRVKDIDYVFKPHIGFVPKELNPVALDRENMDLFKKWAPFFNN